MTTGCGTLGLCWYMRGSLHRGIAGLLTALVLVLHLAGSSQQLHAYLHGAVEETHTCGGHGPEGGPCSGESEPGEANHVCSVVLLVEGIVTVDGLTVWPISAEVVETVKQGFPGSPEACFLPVKSARAPPVL